MIKIIKTTRMICCIIYIIFITYLFNNYNYEIIKINDKSREYITSLEKYKEIRQINQYAIPVSYSSKIGSYISPFHVVHYCIKYSKFL